MTTPSNPYAALKVVPWCSRAIITQLFNLSLRSAYYVPDNWKTAIVKPLLKKPGLELIYTNFHPVSNLLFISEIVETAALGQFYFRTVPKFQSGFRRFHSTETALIKVRNDTLMSMNHQEVSLLVLLDLSAAFDTLDHSILLNVLANNFGFIESAHEWFPSYLSGR